MILKNFQLNKDILSKYNFFLLYGSNKGLIKERIENLFKKNEEVRNYDEKEILETQNTFMENILNRSLFENNKIIIIKRATDKIFKTVESFILKNIDDKIILVADNLEKKSKLRNLFEKKKDLLCIPFYPDNDETLTKLTLKYFREKKISISTSNINLIVNKSSNDRENLFNELEKIESYVKGGKKITNELLSKLINLSENHSISELTDNCLSKNQSKVIKILNENNYINEDAVLISRTFLNKSKKILNLALSYEKNKDINLTISSAKPPIFWKDKEITILQIKKWSSKDIKKLIYKLSEIELIIKKNSFNSLNLIIDFLIQQSSLKANS